MSYPADLQLDAPLEVARWRPLLHWLLAIPHLFIAGILNQIAGLLALISWFVIVITGSLPDGIARFQVMSLRYMARAYSYAGWLREPYPPFDFSTDYVDDRTDPVRVDITPDLEGRNRLTVALRFIWAIPIAVFVWVLGIAMWFAMLVAFFVVLVTGRWPAGLRDFVVGASRVSVRASAYMYLLVDEYPPFSLEGNPAGPGDVPPPPPGSPGSF